MKTIKTTDGNHGIRIFQNGGREDDLIVMAVQRLGDQFEYWYTIGNYKSEKTAFRYASRSLAQHGYALAQ